MTTKWRNAGAPFTTEDGRRVGTGEVFEGAVDSRDVAMRRRKLHPVAPSTEVTVPTDADPLDQYATGGGWYEIDGVKVQGRAAAREALDGA